MRFSETPLRGAYVIDLEPVTDERGFFARSWCRAEFEEHGLNSRLEQCNVTYTRRRATIRGLHYQLPPHEEAKLVRCTSGAVYDVMVDLRHGSATHRQWFGIELSAANRSMVYVPEGFAHGLQTLVDDVELFYQMSESYHPESAGAVRWDDPAFGIAWPLPVAAISARDAAYPNYDG